MNLNGVQGRVMGWRQGYLLGLMHRGDGKAAKSLAKKLHARCPGDNLDVRMRIGDLSMMTGDVKSAMKCSLKEASMVQ